MRLFVSGTGTGVGKTVVTCALARALRAQGRTPRALKPIETGCDPHPQDALALAEAAGDPGLAHHPDFYRARAPVAPAAVPSAGGPPLDYARIVSALRPRLSLPHVLIEGAGGVLVPLDDTRTMADLAGDLGLPLLLVASNALGVLSHTFTAVESIRARGLDLAAVVLSDPAGRDHSSATNADILRSRIEAPVFTFPRVRGPGDAATAGAALLTRMRPSP